MQPTDGLFRSLCRLRHCVRACFNNLFEIIVLGLCQTVCVIITFRPFRSGVIPGIAVIQSINCGLCLFHPRYSLFIGRCGHLRLFIKFLDVLAGMVESKAQRSYRYGPNCYRPGNTSGPHCGKRQFSRRFKLPKSVYCFHNGNSGKRGSQSNGNILNDPEVAVEIRSQILNDRNQPAQKRIAYTGQKLPPGLLQVSDNIFKAVCLSGSLPHSTGKLLCVRNHFQKRLLLLNLGQILVFLAEQLHRSRVSGCFRTRNTQRRVIRKIALQEGLQRFCRVFQTDIVVCRRVSRSGQGSLHQVKSLCAVRAGRFRKSVYFRSGILKPCRHNAGFLGDRVQNASGRFCQVFTANGKSLLELRVGCFDLCRRFHAGLSEGNDSVNSEIRCDH